MSQNLGYEISFGLGAEYTYVTLLLISIIGPLMLSFDKKVAFYKEWKYLYIPVFFVSLAYIVWDILFTRMGIWEFNKDYLLKVFISELPLEEYGFFIVVPYASAFVYACIRAYFPGITRNYNKQLSATVIFISILIMSIEPFAWYTWTTLGLLVISLLYWDFYIQSTITNYLLLAWLLCAIPMLYVNGVLTGKPVLIYNNAENCGIRIGTIPLEDFFYHLLYMVWMLNLYEKLRTKTA